MTTRLNLDVLVIFRTDLAQLERGTHLTVELVLFLRHADVVLTTVLSQKAYVRIDLTPVRIQVTAKQVVSFYSIIIVSLLKLETDFIHLFGCI